jgi:hypothetical protein
MAEQLQVVARIEPDRGPLQIKGRNAWALLQMVEAGPKGVTPIDNPGPRWSAYVFNLKHKHGLNIETRNEGHRGPFPGNHARYVLLSMVEILSQSNPSEGTAA